MLTRDIKSGSNFIHKMVLVMVLVVIEFLFPWHTKEMDALFAFTDERVSFGHHQASNQSSFPFSKKISSVQFSL